MHNFLVLFKHVSLRQNICLPARRMVLSLHAHYSRFSKAFAAAQTRKRGETRVQKIHKMDITAHSTHAYRDVPRVLASVGQSCRDTCHQSAGSGACDTTAPSWFSNP